MSLAGSGKGPGKTEIVQKQGPYYFSISMEGLETEIQLYGGDEFNGLVEPVSADRNGCHFFKSNAPNCGIRRFYLEENDYFLEGAIDEILLGG